MSAGASGAQGGHCGAGCRRLVPDHLRGHCSGIVERSERLEPAAATKLLLAWHWKEGQAKWEAVPSPLPWPARAICRTPIGRWLTKETWNLCCPNPNVTKQSAEEWVWSWETAVNYGGGGTWHPNIEIAVQNLKPRFMHSCCRVISKVIIPVPGILFYLIFILYQSMVDLQSC